MFARKTITALVLLVAGALLLAACSTTTPTPEQVEVEVPVEVPVEVTRMVEGTPQIVVITPTPQPFTPEGTLTVALSAEVNSLESPYAVESNAGITSWSMYDSLVFHALDGSIEPALAESWELSEDNLTYTFHLREGVTFHNGEPFTAEDVVFSWETYSQPDVTYASNWTIASTVEAVDDFTLVATTEDPNPFFLNSVAINWSIIPKDYYEEVGPEGFAEHPVGTGAFMFEEWVRGDHITVVANPNYWRAGAPKVAEVIFRPIPESATRLAAVQTGQVDIATRLSADEAQSLMGQPGVRILRTPLDRVQYIGYNNMTSDEDSPIRDPLVRQALNYALDRQAIVSSIFGGAAEPLSGMFSTNNPGYSAEAGFEYDPEMAMDLLEQAGYPDGFSTALGCPDGVYLNNNETCEAVVGFLAAIGVDVDLTFREANNHWELEVEKQLGEMFMDSWGSSNGEAIQRLNGTLGDGEAYSNYVDPDLQALIVEAGQTVDPQARAEIYDQIYAYMLENPPFLYLLQEVSFAALSTRVSDNFDVYPYEHYWLWDIEIVQ